MLGVCLVFILQQDLWAIMAEKKDEAIAHEWENRRRESMGEKRKEFEAAFAAF